MSGPTVAIVTGPGSSTVRLNLSQPGVTVLDDGFTLGHPSFSGAPMSVGVEYGYRDPKIPVQIVGSESFALGVLQSLVRELTLRRTNWWKIQLSATTQPVWIKSYRGEHGELSLRDAGVGIWQIDVPLVADPFLYGALETMSVFTITNDPAAGSNPCFATLPASVKGDAPTPAIIRNRYVASDQSGYRHMVATSPVPATYTAPIVWPIGGVDGWTVGTDTGASAADAAMSGSNYRPVSFATVSALTDRISGNAPTAVPPGRYKVLLRVARSDTSSTFSMRFGTTIGFSYIYGDTIAWNPPASTATKHAVWADLGDFTFPLGAVLDDLSSEPSFTPNIAIQASRLSGAGSLWLDSIMLVPVGDEYARVLFVDYPTLGTAALLVDEYHDTDQEIVYSRDNTTGKLGSYPPPGLSGGFPVLVPGQTNVLHFVEQTSLTRSKMNTTDVPDRIATQVQIVVSYYPKYSNLRGD